MFARARAKHEVSQPLKPGTKERLPVHLLKESPVFV